MRRKHIRTASIMLLLATFSLACRAQELEEKPDLDTRVRNFLEQPSLRWHDLNVPAADGRVLHDLIIENGYTRALEIGTSTGHSGIWIAWALSRTGGKLITIEIDEARHRQALENFREAGLAEYVDARLGDAHRIVRELEGPFDFVFSDADKDWYLNYFVDIAPKLVVNGCFTAHNVSGPGSWGAGEFYRHVSSLPGYETTLNRSGGGLSISFKRSDK